MYEKKNVLVVGGAGMTGHEAVRQLLDRGAFVRATQFKNRKVQISHPNLTVFSCDLMKYEDCEAAVKDMDIVVNCMAYLRGAKGQSENPLPLVRNNLNPTLGLIEASCAAKVERFGIIGSSTMYPDVEYPVKEEEGFTGKPRDCYRGVGHMKRYCEEVCMYCHDITDTKFALVRTTALYGPFDIFDPEKCHAIPALVLKAHQKNNPFEVWGDGSQVRDFVFIRDLVEGLLLTIEKHAEADPINIASGKASTVNDVVHHIIDQYSGYSPDIVHDVSKPTMIPVRLVDVSKAKSILGWSGQTTLEEGIAETVKWFEKHSGAMDVEQENG